MTTEIELQLQIPARAAALAWANAFLATSDEESRRALYRTLSVEFFFDRGVQFIGCDGTALFRAWVGCDDGEKWPSDSTLPDRRVIAMDLDGFAKAFMSGVVRATADRELEQMTVTVSPNDDGATLALGEEFMSERLTIRAVGQRIDLPILEGVDFPGWRHLNLGIADRDLIVEGLRMQTRLLALLGKLKGVTAVDLEFFGDNRRVEFVAHNADVRGMLMPMRKE